VSTVLGAVYGSMPPIQVPLVFTLAASGAVNLSPAADPFTLTLPSAYSTSAGDCIIIAINQSSNVTATYGASGCGATWQVISHTSGSFVLNTALLIGYNCSGGGTTVSITGGTTHVGDIVVGVFKGVATTTPVIGSQVADSGGVNASNLTTPSLSYSVNQLIVGCGGNAGLSVFSTSVWSNGETNHNAGQANFNASCVMDYLGSPSGSSTTYKVVLASGSHFLNAIVAHLAHV
jgi:hypothetical protein